MYSLDTRLFQFICHFEEKHFQGFFVFVFVLAKMLVWVFTDLYNYIIGQRFDMCLTTFNVIFQLIPGF